jgi:hypothetical protein
MTAREKSPDSEREVCPCSVFGKMGAWEKAVQVLTIMRSEVCTSPSYLRSPRDNSSVFYSHSHIDSDQSICLYFGQALLRAMP